MAYEIIGTIEHIGQTETLATRSGGTFNKRTLVLRQRRFDQNTGQEFDPNFPKLEFTNNNTAKLDGFKPGDRVRVRFDISGAQSTDRNTGEVRYITNLRGFGVEHFTPAVQQAVQPQPVQQQPVQYQPQQYPPQQYPPQQQAAQQPPQQQPLPF